ncbi:MAG TPA: hypothetical protein VNU68_35345 [Verrucomicrobiae bacterium]|nr:hypothetical protein [Verrucomicrobiae bacterium]
MTNPINQPSAPEDNPFENGYLAGQRRVYLEMLATALRGLGRDAPEWQLGRLISEREEAVATCRRICVEHGDNDWPDDLHLSDIIEKHVWAGCDGG